MKGSALFIVNSILLAGLISGAVALQNTHQGENQAAPMSNVAPQQETAPTTPTQATITATTPSQAVENTVVQAPAPPAVKRTIQSRFRGEEEYDD